MSIDVVIVDYFKAQAIVNNIRGLINYRKFKELHFIIMDNSECSINWRVLVDALGELENVTLLKSKTNVGYSKGYNNAMKKSSSDIFIIQNPDIQVKEVDSYFLLAKEISNSDEIGIIGCKQLNPDGTIPSTVRRFPTVLGQLTKRTKILKNIPFFDKFAKDYESVNFNYELECDVPWLQSSFFAIDRATWESLGGFDERFRIFMADVDMCLRCWLFGKRVFYTSSVVVFADGRRSSEGSLANIFTNKVVLTHTFDALKYYFKYISLFFSKAKKARVYNKIESQKKYG